MDTQQTPLYLILTIVLVVIGIIIISFMVSVINQQRYVRRLHRSRIEAEIKTLENERKRIAADIHDELGPLLSAAKIKFNQIENLSQDDIKNVEKGNVYIDEIVAKMRDIARDLMPTVLLYKGTVIGIKEYIAHIALDSHLNILFEADDIPELPAELSLHVYRILQEIIHNTMKHSDAKQLKIVMYAEKGTLQVSTVDDGIGFNYKSISKKSEGFGLYNIQSRIDIVHGSLQVKSKIGEGTRFYITMPIKYVT